MDLRQLRYFASVAREGSFSRASEKLRIAQPALSRHIQSLEYEIGADLLVRTPRGVEVTEAGRLLKEKAEYVLGYVADIKSSVSQLSAEPSGDVVLGISPTLASTFALRLIVETRQRYPKINLRVVEGLSVMLYDWLQDARIDIALGTDFGPVPGVEHREVGEDEIVFVGVPELLSRYADRKAIPMHDILNFPLVLTQGFSQLITPHLAQEGIEPIYEMEISSTPIVREIVLRGRHCSVIASGFVKADVDEGRLCMFAFEGKRIRRRIVTSVSNTHYISPAVKAVDSVIRDEIAASNMFVSQAAPALT
jgi:LysR family nitrogen assimilation transcriptional regulator